MIRSQNQSGMSIGQMLFNRSMQTNTLFVIDPSGLGHYIYEGKKYTVREFREKFPVPFYMTEFNGRESSPDPRREWMRNN